MYSVGTARFSQDCLRLMYSVLKQFFKIDFSSVELINLKGIS